MCPQCARLDQLGPFSLLPALFFWWPASAAFDLGKSLHFLCWNENQLFVGLYCAQAALGEKMMHSPRRYTESFSCLSYCEVTL